MKTLRFFFSFLGVAVLLATGAGLIWVHFRDALGTPAWLGEFISNDYQLGLLGAAMVVLAVGWALTGLPVEPRARYVSFDNPGGEVRVSLSAIGDFLGRLAGEFPWIVSVKPVVSVRDKALHVDMYCRVRTGTAIPAVSQSLQERVRQAIQQSIGLAEVESVSVSVREIVGDPKATRAATETDADFGGAEPTMAGHRPDGGDRRSSGT